MKMYYYASSVPVLAATDGVSYEIAVSGCHFKCKGCQNKELQCKKSGIYVSDEVLSKIVKDIHTYYDKGLLDSIDIIGGEPLDQNRERFLEFLDCLKSEFPKLKIWIYTGYEIHDVDSEILKRCDYIKCGQYIEELRQDTDSGYGPILATSNQYIIDCKVELSTRESR